MLSPPQFITAGKTPAHENVMRWIYRELGDL